MNTPNTTPLDFINEIWEKHMGQPNWDDLHTADEWADELDKHSLYLARSRGMYDVAGDLGHAADCIRALIERCEAASEALKAMGADVAEARRTVRASLESLGKLP